MSDNSFLGSFFSSSQAIINGGTFTINNIQQVEAVGTKGGYDRLMEAVAPNAMYNSGHVADPPKCHPGTRVAIIDALASWALEKSPETRYKYISWLTGAAGAGKTAIGRSVCERCADEGSLLGSFFFSSRDPTRNHSRSLVATLAYQICLIDPRIRGAISSFIEYDPLILTRSMRTQFVSLIGNPLAAIYGNSNETRRTGLLIIDGLDECLDKTSQWEVLDTLLYITFIFSSSPISLRFLVCSRPENEISASFNAPKMTEILFKIFLGREYAPDQDIRLYLLDRFKTIREGHIFKSLLPSIWPSPININKIVAKSSGQFIYADTVVRYVESSRHRPHHRLEVVLGLRAVIQSNSKEPLPFNDLDALYTHIISATTYDMNLILDVIAFPALYPFVYLPTIEGVLNLEPGDPEVFLSELGSIIRILGDEERQVVLLHKSFEDFLFDSHRAKDLAKNRNETRVWHLLRVIQIFSEHHIGCRFESGNGNIDSSWLLGNHNDTSWINSTDSTVIQSRNTLFEALENFPMESFCGSVFAHTDAEDKKCGESIFFYDFFRFLSRVGLKITLDRHVQSFCECTLSELDSKYCDDMEINFIFAIHYLENGSRYLGWDRDSNTSNRNVKPISAFGSMLISLSRSNLEDENDRNMKRDINTNFRYTVTQTFRNLLNTKIDQKHGRNGGSLRTAILSRAAAHCLEFLYDAERMTHWEACRHLGFKRGNTGMKKRSIWRRKRNAESPWRWRWRKRLYRKTSWTRATSPGSRRILANNQPVLKPNRLWTKYILSTYEKLSDKSLASLMPIHPVSAIFGIGFNNVNPGNGTDPGDDSAAVSFETKGQHWFQYLTFLEYLIRFLPLAGQYLPLIHLCETKSFSTMSMIFPSLSRRARDEIRVYLKRVDRGREPINIQSIRKLETVRDEMLPDGHGYPICWTSCKK